MPHAEQKQTGGAAAVMLYTMLFLFFLQLLSDFIEAIYAFGLASTGMVGEVLTALFILAPAVLLFFREGLSGRACIIAGEIMFLARVVEPLLDTRGKMYAAGIGAGCFLVLFPSLLWHLSRREGCRNGQALAGGIVLALALSMLCRVLGSGLDITMWGHGQPAGWVLAAIAALLLPRYVILGERQGQCAPAGQSRPGSGHIRGTVAGALGMMAALVLLYFVFMAPNVVARWTGADYRIVVGLMTLSLAGFAFVMTSERALAALTRPKTLLAWNALFVFSMTLTVFVHQTSLPEAIDAYPIEALRVTPLHWLPLAVMLVTYPVIFVDFTVCARRITALKPSNRAMAAGFTLGSVYLLVMIFAHIFTTVYDYIPVIGPWFRDRFWCVHLAAGLAVAGAAFLAVKTSGDSVGPSRASRRGWPAAAAVAAAAAIAVSIWTTPNPPTPVGGGTLRVLSYNIQQGYSAEAVKNFDGQLDLIRDANPDIIGLSESDTNRIAGGNSDVVRFFADKLNLHSYYGPSPVTGTFGVALLSKYPIRNPKTYFLFSHGPGRQQKEQTAVIVAEVEVGVRIFTVAVTHLGNSGPVYQQEEILGLLAGKENVVLMGDFNFRPPSDSYAQTTQSLVDSWTAKWEGNLDGREVDPNGRIDHIFVSPGTVIHDSRYLTRPESDHPAMVTEIGL